MLRALVVLLALAAPARAGEAQDRLFAGGVLDALPTGTHLVFSHTRDSADARLPAVTGELDVGLAGTGARSAEVTLSEAGEVRSQATLPAGGSPVLLVFLETSLRSTAALTGGSPFYIRNRMREALAEQDAREAVEVEAGGARVAGERLRFRPFVDDPNRARMGALGDLELNIVLSDQVPGGFARLEATTGPGADGRPLYREAFVFERMED
jgi:hypothetical protein